ncbi:MAG: hypothetical protein P8X97_05650 [Candidatus Bathyarchaeota archaeon]
MAFVCSKCNGGKTSTYKIVVRRCQKCGNIVNTEGLLDFLREIKLDKKIFRK